MKENHEATSTVVAKINNINIVVIENGEKRVAIKPICELLGVDYPTQFSKLKEDEILGSTVGLRPMVGADNKTREMQTIPFQFVFGWLFTINPKNVREEARASVIQYKLACYQALYEHLTGYAQYVEDRQQAIDAQLDAVKEAKVNFRSANSVMKEAESELDQLRKMTFEQYKANNAQFTLVFPEEGGKS